MREIKYRAWHKTLNIMCDVAAINFYYGNIVLLARNYEQSKLFQKINKEALIQCDDRLSVSMNEVDLMQYTDLTDKKSKSICECDIIEYTFDLPNSQIATDNGLKIRFGEVNWCDFRNSFAVYGRKKLSNQDLFHYVRNGNTVKVIGNRYENPDLIKRINYYV